MTKWNPIDWRIIFLSCLSPSKRINFPIMYIKNCLIGITLCTLMASCTSHSPSHTSISGENIQDNDSLNLDVKKFTLKNGLRLLVYENDLLPILTFFTFVDTGSRHESIKNGTTGASHFLEHMLFKSTKKYPRPGTINHLFNKMGARTNAYTSYDVTAYFEEIPVRHLDQLIEINADRMKNATIVPVHFESERQVIFEERKLRYENSPGGKFSLEIMREVFAGTPYGSSIIGSVKDLTQLTPEQTLDFYRNFYTPDNMVIVIAGDVKANSVFKKISQAYGDMKPASSDIKKYRKSVDNPKRYRHRASYGREVKIHGSNPYPMFALAYRGEAEGTPRSYVLDILSSILFSGESSWFHQKYLKGQQPLVRTISGYNYGLKFNGVFSIKGELLPNTNLKKFKRRILSDTLAVCNKAINKRSLQKVKNQFMNYYYRPIQTNRGITRFLGTRELHQGDYQHYKKEIESYNAITVPQVKKTCRNLFKKNNHIFFSMWNKHPKKRS